MINNELILKVSNYLQEHNIKVSFVESCTGGALVSALVSVPGASNILEESFVTYSEQAKIKYVHVKKETLEKYSVYSSMVAKEMVEGLFYETGSALCVSITGNCGSNETTCGLAYVGIRYNGQIHEFTIEENGIREEVRSKFVNNIYEKIYQIISK